MLHRRGFIAALIALIVGGVIGWGSVRQPYGLVESRGPVPPLATAAPVKSFRVATFNIHSGRGFNGDEDLSRTALALQGMDLAGLNEVRGPSIFGDHDQSTELGRRLGLAAVFGPSERRWYVTSFGNGLLSRFPILKWRSQPLETGGRGSYRAVILAEIQIGAASVRVLIGHSERGELRDAQLREIKALFAEVAAPALLLGDLNANLHHPLLREIQKLPDVAHALTEKMHTSTALTAIDHIYARGLIVRAAGITTTPASDHPLVWAEVEYPGSS
jgi:endonuclease/exonuclease/phosphatase family metal-dependent hydrolase